MLRLNIVFFSCFHCRRPTLRQYSWPYLQNWCMLLESSPTLVIIASMYVSKFCYHFPTQQKSKSGSEQRYLVIQSIDEMSFLSLLLSVKNLTPSWKLFNSDSWTFSPQLIQPPKQTVKIRLIFIFAAEICVFHAPWNLHWSCSITLK